MADVSVRPARSDDVDEIARIQVSTWLTAYAGFLPPTAMAAVTVDRAAEQWGAAVLQPPTPLHRVLIATEGEERVGFVAFGPDPDADADAEPEQPQPGPGGTAAAEIATLLVEPRWGRRGHGSRLLAATVDHLRIDGFTVGQVWLVDRDRASAEFFESAGWALDGTSRTLAAPGAELREVRLHTDLTAAPDDAPAPA